MIIIARLYSWMGFVQVRCVYCLEQVGTRRLISRRSSGARPVSVACSAVLLGKKNVIREDWFAARNMFGGDGIHVCTENTNEVICWLQYAVPLAAA